MKNIAFQTHFIHQLLSAISNIIYSVRYGVKALQFNLTSWSRSWTILRAFAPGEWKKRIAFMCISCLGIIVTAAALLTIL
jgi:hypothetical protein